MVAAAEASDATAMVAYMKRYDPAYQDAQDEIADLDAIDTVTAYDVDPDHGRIIDEVYDLVTGDVPDDVIAQSVAKQRADSLTAVATEDEDRADDYHWHLEHICHDVNVLRGIFGDVERIDHVDLYADGRYATAHLVYEGGVRCTLESGLSERKWFEEYLRVDTADGVVRLEWSNPFIKNSPTELQVKRGVESIADETRTPSYDEPFKAEIEHFIGAVQGEREVLTPFTEARDDVRLIADLFRHVDSKSLIGDY
jgi:predicted dehydrogenase